MVGVGADNLQEDTQANRRLDEANERLHYLENPQEHQPALGADIADRPFAVFESRLTSDHALALLNAGRALDNLLLRVLDR